MKSCGRVGRKVATIVAVLTSANGVRAAVVSYDHLDDSTTVVNDSVISGHNFESLGVAAYETIAPTDRFTLPSSMRVQSLSWSGMYSYDGGIDDVPVADRFRLRVYGANFVTPDDRPIHDVVLGEIDKAPLGEMFSTTLFRFSSGLDIELDGGAEYVIWLSNDAQDPHFFWGGSFWESSVDDSRGQVFSYDAESPGPLNGWELHQEIPFSLDFRFDGVAIPEPYCIPMAFAALGALGRRRRR